MNWREARDRTLDTWLELRESVGRADEVTLLTGINAVCDLCTKARDEARDDPLDRCGYCLFYRQFGGCHGINSSMSQRVVEHDWNALRQLMDDFIADLRVLELPPE